MNCKDCCQDCQRIGCDIELKCSGYVEPSNGTKEKMDERLEIMHKLYSNSEVKHIFSPSEPMTNADLIRAMTDEELAEYLFDRGNADEYCYGICIHQDDTYACVNAMKQSKCIQGVIAWLKQECDDNGT